MKCKCGRFSVQVGAKAGWISSFVVTLIGQRHTAGKCEEQL